MNKWDSTAQVLPLHYTSMQSKEQKKRRRCRVGEEKEAITQRRSVSSLQILTKQISLLLSGLCSWDYYKFLSIASGNLRWKCHYVYIWVAMSHVTHSPNSSACLLYIHRDKYRFSAGVGEAVYGRERDRKFSFRVCPPMRPPQRMMF